MPKQAYETQEIRCRNGESSIYGIAYIPNAQEKSPLVIFSHELGNSHTSGIPYAERLAEAGYATYVFDFCGGTVGGNKSDGENVGMSIMTEASDLEAILDEALTWDFVDPEHVFLLGGSQGGVVTAVTGCRNADRIAGMMLMYPPLTIADELRERFGSKESVPNEFDMFGGWIHVGGNYATDIWDLNVFEELANYKGDVLLLHGNSDSTVDISVSERASEAIPHCEFHTIDGGRHEFSGQQFEDAIGYILDFVGRHCAESERASTSMNLSINGTDLAVDWEENESVEALRELVKNSPLTIKMSKYDNFEQVGPIGSSLPSADQQMTTQPGDIVLYSGNQIVIFYGPNSWAYTKLGHISGKSTQELEALLGKGDVSIAIANN